MHLPHPAQFLLLLLLSGGGGFLGAAVWASQMETDVERAELVDGDGAAGNANANEIGNGLVERAAGVITAVNLTNLQIFTGALGGVQAVAITNSGDSKRIYEVNGSTFPDFPSASSRACSVQMNLCADAANTQKSAGFVVADCDAQSTQCSSTLAASQTTTFQVLRGSEGDYDIICDN